MMDFLQMERGRDEIKEMMRTDPKNTDEDDDNKNQTSRIFVDNRACIKDLKETESKLAKNEG
jgi:hypothetical protein